MQKGEDQAAACRRGQLGEIEEALRDVNVNCRGVNRMTPLLAAAENGQLDVMKFLVKNGADPTLVDDAGQNALHLGARRGDTECVQFILSLNRVNINATTDEGRTAIDWATSLGNNEVKNILLSQGAVPSTLSPTE